MALTKVVTQDKIEIVGEFKAVQVRTKTAVLEDGVELSSGFHRHVVSAGDDYSAESAEVGKLRNGLDQFQALRSEVEWQDREGRTGV